MLRKMMIAAGCCVLLGGGAVNAAPPAKTSQSDLNDRMRDLVTAGFIEVHCTMPVMVPTVAPIKRSAVAPAKSELVDRFFGGEQGITSSEQTRSPIFGKGTRYKSGKVLYLTDVAGPSQAPKVSHEYVAAFLDLYSTGYVYQNNMPHAPVATADVKITGTKKDVTRFNVYTEAAGRTAVEQLLTGMKGALKVPAGFQSSVQTAIQDYGEKLFVYRVNPEYVTTVEFLKHDGTKQQVKTGIPLHDVFISVQLDGDKLLAGMEYFWDTSLTVSGTPKQGMSAQEAFQLGKAGLLKHFNNEPPLMAVSNVKLGYIIDRKNSANLVPCWVFDATYSQGEARPDPTTGFMRTGMIPMPAPFAVNCLTGDFHALWQ